MSPKISIIMPMYKVETFLENCIQSIVEGQERKSTELSIEVILVDDGSPDRCGEIADSFATAYPYIKVIHKENAGVAAARNTGMEVAQGEWLYFADSDDWLAEGAVEALLKRSQEFYDSDVIFFDAWKNMDKKVLPWEHFDREQAWDKKQDIFRLQRGMLYYPTSFPHMKVPLAAPWDKLYKRSFLRENGLLFAEQLKVLDDMVFNMEVFGCAKKVAYCKDKIYHYRFVPDSITNSYKADRVAKDCEVWAYIQKYSKIRENGGWSEKEKEAFRQSFYCRVIKSFSICCRLNFFHKQNPKTLHEKLVYVKQILLQDPYREAFREVSLYNAEWRLKAIIFMGRLKCTWGIYLLHVANNLRGPNS